MLLAVGFSQAAAPPHSLFQTSTLSALLAGVYDGDLNLGTLRRQGNFGLGTVNGLDGEMVALEGQFYRVDHQGEVSLLTDERLTPFAVVTQFQPQRSLKLPTLLDFPQLQQFLDQQLPSGNLPYAIRVQGTFQTLKFRSVPRQHPPYRPLAEVLPQQSIFERANIQGTLVGFRTPAYLQGINVNGYHFHFISGDLQIGGHVLAGQFQPHQVKIAIDTLAQIQIHLPDTAAFRKVNLSGSDSSSLKGLDW